MYESNKNDSSKAKLYWTVGIIIAVAVAALLIWHTFFGVMIKKTKGEIDNLFGILAATGSASLAEAVSEREERLAMLKEKRREIESRRVTIETNREDIAEAFGRGREMLLSGTIPHLRQLIQLYVSRIEVYPDHISATLNYLPALRAVGSDEAVGNYGAAAQNALEVRENIWREELNKEYK